MLPRVLEPEVMDSPEEARDYDAMDHRLVNAAFVTDFLAAWDGQEPVLDVGTGTAQIPVELCLRAPEPAVVAIDLAEHMLRLAHANVEKAGLAGRIRVESCDAKGLLYPDGSFGAVISNSIVHHIAEPRRVLAEIVRVVRPGGLLFIRDLLRPTDDAHVRHLVDTHAAGASAHQRQMFEDSLRAALTLAEVEEMVAALDVGQTAVTQTSDRHWTWTARKSAATQRGGSA